jgi:addiction module RelB/DinJ family antitoxin
MAQNQVEDVTVQLDKELKASGEALFRSLGMNFSAGVNVLVKQAVLLGRIPSEIEDYRDDPDFQLTYTAKDILQDQADFEAGHIKTYSLAEIKRETNALHG